jgi:hypothetical protein
VKHALLGLILLAMVPLEAAQLTSLADTARKTEDSKTKSEEARKATAPAPSFTARDLIGVEWIITREGYEQYASARGEIAQYRRTHQALHTKLFDASRTVRTLMDLSSPLSSDPAVVDILTRHALTSKEYLRREQAIINATAWSKRPLPPTVKNRPIRTGNVDFIKANDSFVRAQAAKYEKSEGPTGPWFNMPRFVEQP